MPAVNTGQGGRSKHPPYHGTDQTSAWFATRYVHNHIPDISPHDLVQLVASVGQETKGQYRYQSIVNAVTLYKHDKSFPTFQKGATPWPARVTEVIHAAVSHGRKSWVSGFAFTSKDIPGTGGPSNVQKAAIGTQHGLNDVGHAIGKATGGLGDFLSSPILILVILVVVVIAIKK